MTNQTAQPTPDDERTPTAEWHDASSESGTDPATTSAAMPLSGAALVDEDEGATERDLDPEGSTLPPPRLEGTQPGGMPAHRFD